MKGHMSNAMKGADVVADQISLDTWFGSIFRCVSHLRHS